MAEIEQARAKNKDKKVEYRLKALSMRADGASAKKIGEATGYKKISRRPASFELRAGKEFCKLY